MDFGDIHIATIINLYLGANFPPYFQFYVPEKQDAKLHKNLVNYLVFQIAEIQCYANEMVVKLPEINKNTCLNKIPKSLVIKYHVINKPHLP
jgi:hypothetical protein